MILTQSTIESLMLSPCRVTEKPSGVRVPPSEAMFKGTVVHSLIEQFMRGELSKMRVGAPSTVLSVAGKLAREEGHEFGNLVPSRLHDSFAASVANLMMAFIQGPWAETLRFWETVEAEVPRAVQIATLSNGQELWLATGGIDLIGMDPDQGIRGVDFKTSGRAWAQYDGQGRVQHNTYALLAWEDYGHIEDWAYLVGDFSKMAWKWHPAAATTASIASTTERIVQWAEYLILESRPVLCTPYNGKARGWWAKPTYNDGWCDRCRYLGDAHDDDPAWEDTFGARWRRDPQFRLSHGGNVSQEEI
jgi:hypothetical protein